MTQQQLPTSARVAVGPDGTFPEDVFPRPFGNYLLLKVFARGGMGEVYLARQISSGGLERYCVVKKLRKELTRDREYVTRFIDEARVVVHLDHPNICRTFDVGRVGEEYYLAMEYVSGCDVRMIQDKARTDAVAMSADAVIPLMSELLEALDHAHHRRDQQGELLRLVHRDISPQNVMISYDGEVKLIDFGLASSKLKIEKTQPNVVMGKMAYMSPEQARGDAIDHRADLFAVGVMTYEMLSNERFYEGMGTHEIWQVVGRGGFAPKRWRELDPKLQAIIGRALHPDHTRRFATCGAFRDALNDYLADHYPQAGRGTVRAVVEDMFYEEISAERQVLAGFANTTINDLREDIEKSRSQSVSLVDPENNGEPISLRGAGEADVAPPMTRNRDRGAVPSFDPLEEKTPPTGTHTDGFQNEIHDAHTMEAPAIVIPDRKVTKIHDERTALHEHTEFISRAGGPSLPPHESTVIVRTDPTLNPYANQQRQVAKKKRRLVGVAVAAALAIFALLGVIGFIVWQKGNAGGTSDDVAVSANAPAKPKSDTATATGDTTGNDATKVEGDSRHRKRRARSRSRGDRKVASKSKTTSAAEKPTAKTGAKTTKPTKPKSTTTKTPVATKPDTTPKAKEVAKVEKTETAPKTQEPKTPESKTSSTKETGATAAQKAKSAENRREGRELLAAKGYPFEEMYPLALKLVANPKEGESPTAGAVFLRRARRVQGLINAVTALGQSCNHHKCWSNVAAKYVLYKKMKGDRQWSKRFATSVRSCKEQCASD